MTLKQSHAYLHYSHMHCAKFQSNPSKTAGELITQNLSKNFGRWQTDRPEQLQLKQHRLNEIQQVSPNNFRGDIGDNCAKYMVFGLQTVVGWLGQTQDTSTKEYTHPKCCWKSKRTLVQTNTFSKMCMISAAIPINKVLVYLLNHLFQLLLFNGKISV